MLAEQVGKVMKITLNRPAVLNAQTAEMGDRLSEIVADVAGRYGTVGAVVVTGAGRAFSAGGDLKARAYVTFKLIQNNGSILPIIWTPCSCFVIYKISHSVYVPVIVSHCNHKLRLLLYPLILAANANGA